MRKLLATILSITVLFAGMPVIQTPKSVDAAEMFEVTSPTENKLLAAGYIDIKWTDSSEDVVEYDIYINDEYVATTSDTEYEYYTTEVKMHSVSIVAQDEGGSTRETEDVTFGVTKKGLAVNNDMGRNLKPVDMMAGWYYNWGTGPNNYSAYKEIEFVPMIWGPGFDSYIPTIADQGYKYLLSYNEPDMGYEGGGCNTDVQTVIANWPKFLGYDFYLGAPAPALSPSWDSGTMFRTFMDNIDHDTVDFIPLHCYYGQWGGVDGAKSFLEDVVDATYEMYGKPIWITEFAISGWPNNNEWAKGYVKEFMVAVMEGLDERDYVERYSWFSFDANDGYSGAAALWTTATGELTELGEAYVENGNPEGYDPYNKTYSVTESTKNTLLEDSAMIENVIYQDYINAEGVSVTATSENGNNLAQNIIDTNISSRWESEYGVDPQSVVVDLGTVRSIKQFNLIWESSSAENYTIQISEDGINYTTVAIVDNGSSKQNRHDAIVLKDMVQARYIKINGVKRNSERGYSIYDMAVYGTEKEVAIVDILGYQYNTKNNGFRVISSIEPEIKGKKVFERGNIYGIDIDNLNERDINLNNLGAYIKRFAATEKGLSDVDYSESDTADCYIMTMVGNGTSIEALTQKYMVRSYVILEDGEVVYSDVREFTIYEIANYLYQKREMSTEEEHNYLYDNILKVVEKDYEKVSYK